MTDSNELKSRLLSDLSILNLPIDEVDLHIRPFSLTYYGRYFPVYDEKRVRPKIYIYPYKNIEGELLSYEQIIETGIHEMCHHIQYTDSSFVRNKGVMHNPHFWKLYNHYIERAIKLNIIRGEKSSEQTIRSD